MTEEKAGQDRQPDAAAVAGLTEREISYDLERRDWVLQMFIGICNMSGLEVPVTLNLAGSYVAGYIVKPEAYFDGLIADLQLATFQGNPIHEGTAKKSREMLVSAISNMKEASTLKADDAEKDASGTSAYDLVHPRYIHLRGARFFVPNDLGRSLSAPKGLWWRGKIESVSGFYFGMPFGG